jgi:hypothetical protein
VHDTNIRAEVIDFVNLIDSDGAETPMERYKCFADSRWADGNCHGVLVKTGPKLLLPIRPRDERHEVHVAVGVRLDAGSGRPAFFATLFASWHVRCK